MTNGIQHPSDLASLCQGLEQTKGNGTLRLLQEDQVKYELHLKRGKLIEIHEPDKSTVDRLVEHFAAHGFSADSSQPSPDGYQALWYMLAPILPTTFHFHKERYREIIRQSILQQITSIDFTLPYQSELSPTLPALEEDYLPAISLTNIHSYYEDAADTHITAFPEEPSFFFLMKFHRISV